MAVTTDEYRRPKIWPEGTAAGENFGENIIALLTAILSLKLMSFVMLGYIKGLKPISFVALNLDISPSNSELLIFKISSNKCLTGALQY